MTGEHTHGVASARAGIRYRSRLLWSFGLVGVFFVVEVVAGFATNSLALLSDAGHMLTDVLGLGMALAAIQLASRGSKDTGRTFGLYRLEILAALANAVLLFGVAIYVLYEAFVRLQDPPGVLGIPMLVVASLGLVVNLIAFALLRSGAKESLNVQGAFLEVLSDTLGSVGVIVAAIVLQATGWKYVDPIVGAGIGLFILPRTWRLGSQAVRILIEAAPAGIDVEDVRTKLAELPGVTDVHDLHLWTLTSDMEVASAHLVVTPTTDTRQVLTEARNRLRDDYRVSHATLQVEQEGQQEVCEELAW